VVAVASAPPPLLVAFAAGQGAHPRLHGADDNGLVETKNAAIARRHIGFGHIAPDHAARVNPFPSIF